MVIGLQIGKLHKGVESSPPPPAVLDSKKPGLFRVKMPLSSGFGNELLAVSIGLEDFRNVLLLLFKFCIVSDDIFCSVE